MQHVDLSSQDITQAEIDAVLAVLKSDRLSLGPRLGEFEAQFQRRFGVKHAIACSSGTAGLHLCWHAMDIGADDEVITTPFTFIASSNSLMIDGARPVFVDIDPITWQIDANHVEAVITPKTRALLPVDIFGNLPDMDALAAIARKHQLRVLEDSCEALGARYKQRYAGTIGEAGVFAFYPNKQITTGEGGMVITNDDDLAFIVRSCCNQGRDPDAGWLAHARFGYNYRLTDIQAAMGTVQMKRLDEILAKRQRVADLYCERLADESRISMMQLTEGVENSWFVFVVALNEDYTRDQRDAIIQSLRDNGIGCNNYFTPVHLQPFYLEQFGFHAGQFPITESLAQRTIALPFHNHLTEREIDYVVGIFRGLL